MDESSELNAGKWCVRVRLAGDTECSADRSIRYAATCFSRAEEGEEDREGRFGREGTDTTTRPQEETEEGAQLYVVIYKRLRKQTEGV